LDSFDIRCQTKGILADALKIVWRLSLAKEEVLLILDWRLELEFT